MLRGSRVMFFSAHGAAASAKQPQTPAALVGQIVLLLVLLPCLTLSVRARRTDARPLAKHKSQ
jgi:hypothetical protein